MNCSETNRCLKAKQKGCERLPDKKALLSIHISKRWDIQWACALIWSLQIHKFDSCHNVMTQVKFRRICMESSEHNWANISETICPTMLVFGKQASQMLFFQAILTNPIISNFNFYNVITLALCLGHHNTYTKRLYFIEFSPVQHQYPVLILPLLF